MSPKHIDNIADPKRRAIAPYNFVELPEKVVEAESLPDGDRYHVNRHTGRIECILTTESPLYTRCGWSPEDFAEHGEKAFNDLPPDLKQKRANFFINPATNQPVIPGSSIRGMLRTLVEIVSFSKIERVSGNQRLFFRAVGSNQSKESWGKEYKQYVNPKIVKAGYLTKNGDKWYIQPAVIDQGVTFAWVRENSLNLPNYRNFNHDKYEPQYIYISYKSVSIDNTDRAKRLFAHDIDLPDAQIKKGVLVTSGNMKQSNEASPRCNDCLIFAKDKNTLPLPIDDKAIEHYRNALTEFQKAAPFDQDWGVLKEDRPVFYYHDGKSETVGFFGQSPNFRIPYSPEGNGHATTVLDFIPTVVNNPYVINWNNTSIQFSVMLLNVNLLVGILFVAIPLIDLADAIFGWVKQESENEKLPEGFDKQRAGRVFVTDALCESNQNGIWYSETPVTPQILSEPKPSYFPHYLLQPSVDKSELKHYASQPVTETVIRGYKLYWHKGSNPNFKIKKVIGKKQVSDTQTTLIKLIKQKVTFKFNIHFENLSDVELGALLWILSLSSNKKSQQLETGKPGEQYCFSLGMGKPLGMGAVKIDYKLHLSDRTARYSQLFNGDGWSQDEKNQDEINSINEFEKYVLNRISENDYPDQHNRQELHHLNQIPRIEMLLAMLRCDSPAETTDYMELESFKDRKVLPTPLDIRKIEDKRRFPTNSTSSPKTESTSKPKPQKQSDNPQKEPENKVNLVLQRGVKLPKPKPKS